MSDGRRVVEVRTYRLKQGSGDTFHHLVHDLSIPMVKRWGHDVLAYGPSLTDVNSYFLIRAYDSLEQMLSDQDAFYSSDEWRQGPREEIIALIEQMSEAVFLLSSEAVDAIRANGER